MTLLDIELENIEKNQAPNKKNEIPELKVAISDTVSLKFQDSEPKPQKEVQNVKNESILKEASRLFGEPEIVNLS